MHLCLPRHPALERHARLVLFAEVWPGCLHRLQLLCLYVVVPPNIKPVSRTRARRGQLALIDKLFSSFVLFFCRRATGGPEVAMGTGPWPQPPTEAEQLQALMAAANGECSSSSSFLFLLPLTLRPLIFWLNLLLPCTTSGVGVCGHVVCLGLRLEGNEPDWLIDSPCVHIDFFSSVWRLSRGRLSPSRSSGHESLQLPEQT